MKQETKQYAGCITVMILGFAFLGFLGIKNIESEESKKEKLPGKYLYVDRLNTLHARNKCLHIGDTDIENPIGNKAVTRILTKEVDEDLLVNTCAWCINDEVYDKLERIAKRNRRGYEYYGD